MEAMQLTPFRDHKSDDVETVEAQAFGLSAPPPRLASTARTFGTCAARMEFSSLSTTFSACRRSICFCSLEMRTFLGWSCTEPDERQE